LFSNSGFGFFAYSPAAATIDQWIQVESASGRDGREALQGARIARRDNRLPAAAQCDRGLCRHRRAAPEFNRLAPTSRRACLIYIRLIEQTFDDLPLAALADRRVPGEFKTWRSRLGETRLQRRCARPTTSAPAPARHRPDVSGSATVGCGSPGARRSDGAADRDLHRGTASRTSRRPSMPATLAATFRSLTQRC
jgi:hypothetical protein